MGSEFVREIIRRLCKAYFKEIDHRKVFIHFTGPKEKFGRKRRAMGIWEINDKKVVIQMDREFVENADPISLTEKIAHELAHLKLKHPEKYSFSNEVKANRELKRLFREIKKRDKALMKKF